jgi:hypothetical protein
MPEAIKKVLASQWLLNYSLAGLGSGTVLAAIYLWGEHESVRRSLLIGTLAFVSVFAASLVGNTTRVWLDARRLKRTDLGGRSDW